MANTIKIRRSATSGATPTTSQLALGELAINTYDGKLFLKKDNGSASIIEIGGDVTSSTPRKVLLYEKANTGNADSFDGSETRFQLRDENGAIITDIASAYQLLISVDGVVQESNSSSSGTNGYYITNNTASGTDIVFLAAPASGSDFFGTSVTTSNFYVNNISESGSTTTIDGLVKVTGGIQATENVTPTTGSGVEIFKASSTAGQVSAFDRSGSAWMDLLLKGKEQIFYANGSEAMRVDSSGDVGINTGSAINLTASGRKTLAINGNSETAISFSHSGTLAAFLYTSSTEFRMQSEIAADLVFRPNNSEAMRLLSTGGLTFNGDTAQSNALDDYEEGTFTPNLDVTGTSGSLSIGYSAQVGRYVKIGKTCFVTIDIRLTSFSRGSGTGGILIKGLPFTPVDSNNYSRASTFADLYNWSYSSTAGDIPYISVFQNDNHPWANVFLHRRGNTATDVSDPSNTSMLFASLVYETS